MSSALTPDDPQRIAGYWLAARLGAGGQGVVYEAYDGAGVRYALKTLHRGAERVHQERFAREAETARRVAAFCTARILDSGVDGDVAYLVSEYVSGPTLASRVRAHGPMESGSVLRLATGVATALAAIHQAGVLHRDLKPGNVLLGPDGPRIIDFGIARTSEMSLTATGAIMGTLGYMAPEVLAGRRATEASDVFAWAAVVLYAATATEPFRGENIAEVAHRTTTVTPDLRTLPAPVRPLIAAALSKDPQHRPTAGDLLMGLVGAPVRAADPRIGLIQEGARKAAVPARGTGPGESDDADAVGGGTTGSGTGSATGEGRPPRTAVEASLGERAEAAFTALSPAAQSAAHELLLRLVVPGSATDGSQDSVRTAQSAEILAGRPDAERRALTEAVQALTEAGILVTEADGSVRPVSAALVPAWRRLRAGVDVDRPGIARLQRISGAAQLWEAHGERPEDLLRGTELRACLEWLPTAPYHLRPSPLERRFLAAGRTAAARTARRRRQLLAGLAAATTIALVAGGVAWTQSREAELRRSQATARAVAQAAEALRGTEPEKAMLLGLASWRLAEVPEARAALTAAAVQPERAALDVSALPGGLHAISPDGRRLMTTSGQGISFWDLSQIRAGGAEPRVTLSSKDFRLDDLPTNEPVLSPDARLILLRGKDGSFRLVRTEDGTPAAPPLKAAGYHKAESVSNAGHVLLAGTHQSTVFDVSGRGAASQPARTAFFQYALTPDGMHFVSCVGKRLQVRSTIDSGDLVIDEPDPDPDPHGAGQCQFRFSPDGRYLIAQQGVSADVYDLEHGKKVTRVAERGLPSLRFSSGGRFLFSVSGDTITVRDRDDAELPLFKVGLPTRGHGEYAADPQDIRLDEERGRLLHYSGDTGRIYEIDLGQALDRRARDEVAESISSAGNFGVLTNSDADAPAFQVVDLRSGKHVGSRTTADAVGMGDIGAVLSAVDDEGRLLAYTRGESTGRYEQRYDVVIRDVRAGKDVHRIPLDDRRPTQLALSPDGRYLSLGTSRPDGQRTRRSGIEVWDLRKREKVHEFEGDSGHAVFSQDGRRVLTSGGGVIDLSSGTTRTGVLGGSRAVGIVPSPDGRFVAALTSSGWLELRDGTTFERLALMPSQFVPGGSRYRDRLGAMAFSGDGRLLAVAVNDDGIQLWDTEARLPLGRPLTYTGHRIDDLFFDGLVLKTVTGDRVHSLDLTPEQLAAAVCRRAGRDITPEEWNSYVPDSPYRRLC